MKKILMLVIISLLLLGCSNDAPQINLTKYPTQVTQGEKFTVKGELLTKNAKTRNISLRLTIRELDTDRGLVTEAIDLTYRSQGFSFSNLDLEQIDAVTLSSNIYFELKLIVNGNFTKKITTKKHPTLVANWHTDIITTYFNANSGSKGTWGNLLAEENPYYFALPYRDFFQPVDGSDDPVHKKAYGITDVKNRWIEIYYSATDAKNNYVYAQWEDVGPWNYYDPHYVFSTNDQRPYAEMGIDMGWSSDGYRSTNGAGLDISPTAMKHLTGVYNDKPAKGKIKVNWRFISRSEVPDGPWLDDVSTSQANSRFLNLETKTLRNYKK